MSLKAEVKKLIKDARQWEGWRVEEKKNGWMLYPPNKELSGVMVHKTPSENRHMKNIRADLKKRGAPI